MRLTPYPSRDLRWFKVCKHVFDHRERWWEVYGDLGAWQRDWTRFRSGGALPASDRTVPAIAADPALGEQADRHHIHWFEAAQSACTQADQDGWVLDTDRADTRCYIGNDGTTVYVVRGHHLRTCFRPARAVGARRTAEQARDAAHRRASRSAVRRFQRRASLLAENTPPGDQEGSA